MEDIIEYLEIPDILKVIHNKVVKKGIFSLRNLGDLIHDGDSDPNRELDIVTEIPKMFADSGIFLNKTEQTELTRILDTTQEFHITFDQLIEAVAPPLSDRKARAVKLAFDFFSKGKDEVPANVIGAYRFKRPGPRTFAVPKTPISTLLNGMVILFGKEPEDIITRTEFEDYFRLSYWIIPDENEFVRVLNTNMKD